MTSTEPYLFIDRPHESPFNVGEILELRDFTQAQIQQLNQLHGSPLFEAEMERLWQLLHGQPYLTRKAFYSIKTGLSPDEFFDQADEDTGPLGDHLRNYLLRLFDYPELAGALKQIAAGRDCPDKKLVYRLQGAGLVKTESGRASARCALYAKYFSSRL